MTPLGAGAAKAALGLSLVLAGCLSQVGVEAVEPAAPVASPRAFSHAAYGALLGRVVTPAGLVDYRALQAEADALDAYLATLAATRPDSLGRDARLAFWLNAYNASTLRLVLAHYPTESVLKTISGPFVPGVNSPFSDRFIVVGGERMSLDDIEHGTVRAEWDEPRIHFALVCAAVSCPPLRAEAYAGERLDAQLDDQARRFLADTTKNRVSGDAAELSKIFDWFKGDFGGSDAAVQRFIAPYFPAPARRRLEAAALDVRYLPYSWSLNDAPDG